jgi:hypothetical protein
VGAVKEAVVKGAHTTAKMVEKVAGRRSMFWSTRDWTMEELTGVEKPQNFYLSAR